MAQRDRRCLAVRQRGGEIRQRARGGLGEREFTELDHAQRRSIATLRQLAGTAALDLVEPLAETLLQAGWALLDERHDAGQWWLQYLQWTDLPALQRLLLRGWVASEWRDSENNRRARFYRITGTGRRQFEREVTSWRRATGGVDRVLRASAQEA